MTLQVKGHLCKLKLLLHVWNDCLALETEESSGDKLGVDRVSADHLPTDLQESADLSSGQFPNPASSGGGGRRRGGRREEGDYWCVSFSELCQSHTSSCRK